MKGTVVFVTGIGTDVGKTIASAILVEALEADYFKPIQAGDLENSDTHNVQGLVSNTKSKFHPNSYALKTPMSPHAAAEIDGVEIETKKIVFPQTENTLVVEGAGGLLVPLNNRETVFDLIRPEYKVVVVSRHYLGSINHTLLTINALKEKGADVALFFNGPATPTSEGIIEKMTSLPVIGRIDAEKEIDKAVIKKYAEQFRNQLKSQFQIAE